MKINKLHTLSQFIEILIPERNIIIKRMQFKALCFDTVVGYTNFIKQPLTEEMVFNKRIKPINDKGFAETDEAFYKRLESWKTAEKKVIFENVIVEPVGDVWRIGRYWMQSEKDGAIFLFDNETKEWIPIKTLHDLAEITNGEIELKNVEI